MFDNLTAFNWVAIALGGIVIAHLTGIVDASKWPIIGQLLKAIGLIKDPDPVTPPAVWSDETQPQPQPQDQQTALELRCQKLALELLDLRHFASEQPTAQATVCLEACDVLGKELSAYHEKHSKRNA
jgi:hypothetical protein